VKSLGPEGEDIAVRHLKGNGLKILHRNYKTPIREADISAPGKRTTVFIEVKARSSARFCEPFEAVDARKRETLRKVAPFYLKHGQKHGGSESLVRFDVVSIKISDDDNIIEHIT
jgi:putative endonuclease